MPFGSKERDSAGQLLVEVVASVLQELVNSSSPPGGSGNQQQQPAGTTGAREVTKFHGLRSPGISVAEYLSRISRFSGCSNPCFVLSLIYIDRLITRKRIVLDPLNVHRLVITSVLLAAKFFDDLYLDNAHYAAVGGIPTRELNSLEVEFSFLAEFHLHVNASDYDMYHTALSTKAQALNVSRPLSADQQQGVSPVNGGGNSHDEFQKQQQQKQVVRETKFASSPSTRTAVVAGVGPWSHSGDGSGGQ